MVSRGKGEWFHEGKHEVRAEEQSRRGKGWTGEGNRQSTTASPPEPSLLVYNGPLI